MSKNGTSTNKVNTIRRKMTLLIIGATLLSLLLGAPISYIQFLVFDSGVTEFLGDGINSILQTYFTLIINTLIIVLILSYGLRRMVIQPVQAMNQTIQSMQEENRIRLDQRVKIDKKDEIGQLGGAFNKLNHSLEDVIGTVRESAGSVAEASERNAAAVEEINTSSSEVYQSAEMMLTQAKSGNQAIEGVSQALLELSSLIQIAKEKAGESEKTAAATLEEAENGRAQMSTITDSIHQMREEASETKTFVSSLDDYSKQIHSIVDTITQISEQTNLLALNAAIEAARAGESGKGFAVVADEVRKLAEQTSNEAEHVTSIINEITKTTTLAVEAMEKNDHSAAAGVENIEFASRIFDTIFASVQQTATDMSDIREVTAEEVATSDKIISLIDQLGTFVEQTEKQAEHVSTAASETNETLETIAVDTEKLTHLAGDLTTSVKIFDTRSASRTS
ncbi:methyl-accepting chemotaxis protein [Alkalicoccus chagannorensis]|uniref:methyl-accepting chemotaxis protein n=1 Tax=Alkalicoccus chagannorensis TaxID=427072 RepID=UPI0003F9C8DE|nr:HAMP domain-containing methyl-accepting chemotaxis protein [Alkalicoccus chagannorensis]